VLHSFSDGTDGGTPAASLISVGGELYGTTRFGGANGGGVAFKMTTAGKETVLHAFGGATPVNDGSHPNGLMNISNNLFGTTSEGGANYNGTVFKLTTKGKETVLYSFGSTGSGDGIEPSSSLIDVKGILYGTTYYGGPGNPGSGTLFGITEAGVEKVLYPFGGSGDGTNPTASLLSKGATLYGTTPYGGANSFGTVYSFQPDSKKEKVTHSFGAGTDGTGPESGLINIGGTFYGTTFGGGVYAAGTVYQITASGKETVLYSFGTNGNGDGSLPVGSLINVNGTLYGTTNSGGANGAGTVFMITPAGNEAVVYSFQSGDDAHNPEAGLVDINGTLYGTTVYGGKYDDGAVFAVTP
jgi:uncharacterized repeat protein (TIGR03803 family)